MVAYQPTVSGNLRSLDTRTNRIATAPVGPMSIGPDEGWIRVYDDADIEHFRMAPEGASVRFEGGNPGLTGVLEDHAYRMRGAEARLTSAEGRLSSAEGRLGAAEGRLGRAEGRLDGHDSAIAALGGRMGRAEGRLDGHDSAIAGKASIGYVDSVSAAAKAAAGVAQQAREDAATVRGMVNTVDRNSRDRDTASGALLSVKLASIYAAIAAVADRTGGRDIPGLPNIPG